METIFSLTDDRRLDEQSLINIYEQHSPALFRYAYRLLGDTQLAEECVSETFSRLLQALRNGAGPTLNLQAYLYRVAHNWVTDYYRHQPLPPLHLDDHEQADYQSNPAHVVTQQMEIQRLRAAILRLPPDQQRVILLRVLEELPHEDVATLMGKTPEATRALQYRALSALRRMLTEKEGQNDEPI